MRFEETIGISATLNHVSHQLSQCIEQALRPLGLTLPQYSTLSALEMLRCATNADLARTCLVTPQTMNRILANLHRLKLIKIKNAKREPANKKYFELTQRASLLVCDAHICVNDIEAKMIRPLAAEDFKRLESQLQAFMNELKLLSELK